MTNRFQNTYRIPSARAPWWDYGSNAAYFVTICLQGRDCYFGEIRDETMYLSEIGVIAENCWNGIPNHFPFVKLDAFIVMPNHVHGILVIDKSVSELNEMKTMNGATVETQNIASLQTTPRAASQISSGFIPGPKNHFGPQSKNLASIIRGFKVGVTKNARLIHADFAWQSRFYDHIIRNEQSFQTIETYINNNPANWVDDKFYCKP